MADCLTADCWCGEPIVFVRLPELMRLDPLQEGLWVHRGTYVVECYGGQPEAFAMPHNGSSGGEQ